MRDSQHVANVAPPSTINNIELPAGVRAAAAFYDSKGYFRAEDLAALNDWQP